MKKLLGIMITIIALQAVFAESNGAEGQSKDFSITPVLLYEYLRLPDLSVHSSGEGIIFTKGDFNPPLSEDRNSLIIAGIAKQFFIMESDESNIDLTHDIQIMTERKFKKHYFLGVFSSQAEEPISGGLHTFVLGLGYGYEFIRKENISLTLGVGLGLTDWGIEYSDGKSWPVLPVPIVQLNVETSWLNFNFGILNSVNVGFTLLPESKVRLTGFLDIDPFGMASIRDLCFDTTLWYRFFSKDSKMGDFMGIGVGFKNYGFGSVLADKEKSYQIDYLSAYGILDMSFLKLSGGYTFDGRQTINGEDIYKLGEGFFVSAMLGWQF